MIYTIKHGACPFCIYKYRSDDDEPCVNCCHHYDDLSDTGNGKQDKEGNNG